MMAKASEVWKYFNNVSTVEGQCKLCDAKIKRNENTTNLICHLRSKHQAQHNEYQGTVKKAKSSEAAMSEKDSDIEAMDDNASECSGKSTNRKIIKGKPTHQQRTLAQYTSMPISKSRENDITDAVVHWLTKDGLPLFTVEKPGYQHMMSVIERKYNIPSRKTIARRVTKDYENAEKSLKEYIKKQIVEQKSFCSITTDMWTSATTDPYMAVTMHSIDENWELEAKLLQCAYLPGSHTGDILAESLMECVCEWGLSKTTNISDVFGASIPYVSAIVTDNGSNIVKACSNLKANRIPCFGHCLNLAVNKGLADDRISRAIGAVRKLCSHFSHSTQRQEELRKAQDLMNLPRKKLRNDCETR